MLQLDALFSLLSLFLDEWLQKLNWQRFLQRYKSKGYALFQIPSAILKQLLWSISQCRALVSQLLAVRECPHYRLAGVIS